MHKEQGERNVRHPMLTAGGMQHYLSAGPATSSSNLNSVKLIRATADGPASTSGQKTIGWCVGGCLDWPLDEARVRSIQMQLVKYNIFKFLSNSQ